ncbi:MAG: hypothetical protein KatS3mg068_0513 [Candidatus Sericytochromatia bacterium]|nr:MAG: hypothetical protein KatS3mg068_0513 [Candidatus Sericytochromatia bacterium]
MLVRTQRKIISLFIISFLSLIGYTFYYQYNKPKLFPETNILLRDVALYKDRVDDNSIVIMIPWYKKVSKKSATDIKNFTVEQVLPSGRKWIKSNNPKKCKIISIQYTYAPWVDTEEKRKKVDPEKREQKVSQLRIKLDRKAEEGDYFKITARNIQLLDENKKIQEEYIVTPITSFNKFIKL